MSKIRTPNYGYTKGSKFYLLITWNNQPYWYIYHILVLGSFQAGNNGLHQLRTQWKPSSSVQLQSGIGPDLSIFPQLFHIRVLRIQMGASQVLPGIGVDGHPIIPMSRTDAFRTLHQIPGTKIGLVYLTTSTGPLLKLQYLNLNFSPPSQTSWTATGNGGCLPITGVLGHGLCTFTVMGKCWQAAGCTMETSHSSAHWSTHVSPLTPPLCVCKCYEGKAITGRGTPATSTLSTAFAESKMY